MAYKVVQIRLSSWAGTKFKDAEDDTDFDTRSYPELDDYLSTMESRGWTVVSTAIAEGGGFPLMLITLHQQDSFVLGSDD